MKNKRLFDKTISILINAYLKGTLYHSEGCACVIGNLVAFYNNYKIITDERHSLWYTKEGLTISSDWVCLFEDRMPEQLKCIGYARPEIVKIEAAFESKHDDTNGYKGLMNVVDALIEIHQGTDDHKKEAKELFKISF